MTTPKRNCEQSSAVGVTDVLCHGSDMLEILMGKLRIASAKRKIDLKIWLLFAIDRTHGKGNWKTPLLAACLLWFDEISFPFGSLRSS